VRDGVSAASAGRERWAGEMGGEGEIDGVFDTGNSAEGEKSGGDGVLGAAAVAVGCNTRSCKSLSTASIECQRE